MELSIVIVNYNSTAKALNCLRSIYANYQGTDFEVIVVDNNSQETTEELRSAYPNVLYIESDRNLGMGGGNNLGIKQARGDYILILNPDTELLDGALAQMLSQLKADPKIGLIGPRLIYPDGERQISCYRFPSLLMPLYRRTFLGRLNKAYLENYLYKNEDLDRPLEVDWIMGSCLLIPRSVITQVGSFDERFFMYFEDTDLCRRIWNAGFKVVYYPLATVIHHHGRASAKEHWARALFINRMSRVHLSSWLKYLWKWRT